MNFVKLIITVFMATILVCHGSILKTGSSSKAMKKISHRPRAINAVSTTIRGDGLTESENGEDDAEDVELEDRSSRTIRGVKVSAGASLNTTARQVIIGAVTLKGNKLYRFKCRITYARVIWGRGYCLFRSTLQISGRYLLVLSPCSKVRLLMQLRC